MRPAPLARRGGCVLLTAAALVAASLLWLPSRGTDMAERESIAAAIVQVTRDDLERALLMVTATEESLFDTRIIRCAKTGDHGRSVGAFQTSWRSRSERSAVCADPVRAARRALALIHESQGRCRWLPPPDRLSNYAASRCSAPKGRAISRRRWTRATAAVAAQEES